MKNILLVCGEEGVQSGKSHLIDLLEEMGYPVKRVKIIDLNEFRGAQGAFGMIDSYKQEHNQFYSLDHFDRVFKKTRKPKPYYRQGVRW